MPLSPTASIHTLNKESPRKAKTQAPARSASRTTRKEPPTSSESVSDVSMSATVSNPNPTDDILDTTATRVAARRASRASAAPSTGVASLAARFKAVAGEEDKSAKDAQPTQPTRNRTNVTRARAFEAKAAAAAASTSSASNAKSTPPPRGKKLAQASVFEGKAQSESESSARSASTSKGASQPLRNKNFAKARAFEAKAAKAPETAVASAAKPKRSTKLAQARVFESRADTAPETVVPAPTPTRSKNLAQARAFEAKAKTAQPAVAPAPTRTRSANKLVQARVFEAAAAPKPVEAAPAAATTASRSDVPPAAGRVRAMRASFLQPDSEQGSASAPAEPAPKRSVLKAVAMFEQFCAGQSAPSSAPASAAPQRERTSKAVAETRQRFLSLGTAGTEKLAKKAPIRLPGRDVHSSSQDTPDSGLRSLLPSPEGDPFDEAVEVKGCREVHEKKRDVEVETVLPETAAPTAVAEEKPAAPAAPEPNPAVALVPVVHASSPYAALEATALDMMAAFKALAGEPMSDEEEDAETDDEAANDNVKESQDAVTAVAPVSASTADAEIALQGPQGGECKPIGADALDAAHEALDAAAALFCAANNDEAEGKADDSAEDSASEDSDGADDGEDLPAGDNADAEHIVGACDLSCDEEDKPAAAALSRRMSSLLNLSDAFAIDLETLTVSADQEEGDAAPVATTPLNKMKLRRLSSFLSCSALFENDLNNLPPTLAL